MDYYAYLVSKGLAAYQFNPKPKEMELDIKKDEWKRFLDSKRYGLSSPHNAELTLTKFNSENVLCEKTKHKDKQYKHYLIHLGQKDSVTYAPKISLQQIFQPTIPGWRSKKRYLRRTTNKQVLDTLLQNEEVYLDAIKELDQKLISKPDEDDNEPIKIPITKRTEN